MQLPFRFLFLLSMALGLAGPEALAQAGSPATGQSKQTATPHKPRLTAPDGSPLYALPAPVTPTRRPLARTLPLTRQVLTSADDPAAGAPDTIRAQFSYVAPRPGNGEKGGGFQLHDPDDRHYGMFSPGRHAHFLLEETTAHGPVTRYYIINGVSPGKGTGPAVYHTTCATQYPPGHPGAPDKARSGFLELEYHPECDVRVDLQAQPPTVTIRQPRNNTVLRYQ